MNNLRIGVSVRTSDGYIGIVVNKHEIDCDCWRYLVAIPLPENKVKLNAYVEEELKVCASYLAACGGN